MGADQASEQSEVPESIRQLNRNGLDAQRHHEPTVLTDVSEDVQLSQGIWTELPGF